MKNGLRETGPDFQVAFGGAGGYFRAGYGLLVGSRTDFYLGLAYETLHQMHPYQAPLRVPDKQSDARQARYSMPILPKGESQNGRGAKQTIDAGQMGQRDDGRFTLN